MSSLMVCRNVKFNKHGPRTDACNALPNLNYMNTTSVQSGCVPVFKTGLIIITDASYNPCTARN